MNLSSGPKEASPAHVPVVADTAAAAIGVSHRDGSQDAEGSESSQSAASCLPAQAVAGGAEGRWVLSPEVHQRMVVPTAPVVRRLKRPCGKCCLYLLGGL